MRISIMLTAAFVAAAAVLGAETLVLRWREVPLSLVAGRKVDVELKSGQSLKGKVLGLTPEGLHMAVGKGESVVPAGEIASLKVNRTGRRGRIIGAAIGGGLGGVTATGVWAVEEGATNKPAMAVAAGIPTAIGYLLGWARDYQRTTIQVEPDGPAGHAGPRTNYGPRIASMAAMAMGW